MRPSLSVVQTLAVAAEEGGAGGLFADEAEGAVDEAVDEPLEADGDFEHGAVEAFGDAVDDAGGDEGFADADLRTTRGGG